MVEPDPSSAAFPAPTFSAGGAVSTAFRLFFRHLGPFALVSLAFFTPAMLLDLAGAGSQGVDRLSQMVWAILRAFAAAALTRGTLDALGGAPPRARPMFGTGAARGTRVFGAALLSGLLTVLGAILFIVPGLVAAAGLFVAEAAAAAEPGTGPRASISRSWELTRGHRWGVLAVLLLFQAIPLAAILAASFVAEALPGTRGVQLGGEVLAALALALQAVAAAVTYHGLRTEKEGVEVPTLAAVFE
jgi:hypothetical protein